MLFNSYTFIFVFLPIMLFCYFWLLRLKLVLGAKIWLVGGSLFFYGYWNIVYIPLLLGSIFINFFVGSALSSRQKLKISKNTLLFFGIIFNIVLLCYFKYTDFLLENFNDVFATNVPLPHIVLPLGISFFTFTQIAFLVDAYKNEVKEYDLLRYMLFVTYFPHLLAGPILHHKEMMPQFANKWNFVVRWRNIAIGLFLFSIGLFKKVVIADTLAQWANAGFNSAVVLNFFEAWVTSLSYTLQLYYDFSSYVDMAIGISLMFNIRLPINFNSPYKAKDIQDFWRRWHITLSRFLRDYIYIPLGGNKVSKFRNYTNLFSVFLIGGIWHGASWMFVIWGALHGIAIVFHRIWKDLGFKMWRWLGWLLTFNFVNIAWIFFRAENWESAKKILFSMAGLNNVMLPNALANKLSFLQDHGIIFGDLLIDIGGNRNTFLQIILGVMIILVFKNSNHYLKVMSFNFQTILFSCFIFLYSILSVNHTTQFLYFNF